MTGANPINGIGDLLAAKIVARAASIHRFHSSAAFASYCGVAPLEASLGAVKRHRLSRHGEWRDGPWWTGALTAAGARAS